MIRFVNSLLTRFWTRNVQDDEVETELGRVLSFERRASCPPQLRQYQRREAPTPPSTESMNK